MVIDRYPTKTPSGILIVCLLLFFASGGLSETFAVFQFAFLAYWILYLLLTNKTNNAIKLLISGWIGAFLSIVVIVAAPGNKIRQSFSPPTLSVLEILQVSTGGYLEFLKDLIFTPEKITVLMGVLFLFIWAGSTYTGNITEHKVKILLTLLGAAILSFVCFPPGVYGYGEPPPQRTMIIPLFVIATLLPVTGFILGNYFQTTKIKSINVLSLTFSFALLFILISSAINANILYKSRTEYIDFSKKWDATNNLILNAKANDLEFIEIPAMKSWTRLDRPNNNPKHWMTKCYSDFYGIQVFGPPY